MIDQLLQRYEQECSSGTTPWECFDNASECAYIRGIQQGALLMENSLHEVIEIAEEGGALALALEDLAADLSRRVTAEKRAIDQVYDVPTRLGYIQALKRGVQDLQIAAQEEWRSERDEV